MPFERFEFTKRWTSEKDFPTFEPSEEQVRKDLQLQPDELKKAIHGLIDGLEAATAGESLGCSWKDGGKEVRSNLAAALAAVFEDKLPGLQAQINQLSLGDAPDGVLSATVTFQTEDWEPEEDGYAIAVPKDGENGHRRTGPAFGYQIWVAAEDGLRTDTWCGAGTAVAYQTDGTVKLTAEEPYEGKIVFFGI